MSRALCSASSPGSRNWRERSRKIGGTNSDLPAASTCGDAKLRKAVKDDVSEQREIADDEREEAHIKDLLQEPGNNISIMRERPEKTGQRDVDRDQCRGQISDIARQQAEAAIDIGDESRQEGVDDAH